MELNSGGDITGAINECSFSHQNSSFTSYYYFKSGSVYRKGLFLANSHHVFGIWFSCCIVNILPFFLLFRPYYGSVLLINFFSGLILMVISFIMGLIKSTVSANSFLKVRFCYADELASLALLRQGMKDKSSDAAFDWNVTGASICYLGVESICYFLLTLGLELLPSYKEWWSIKSFRRDGSPHLEPLLGSSAEKVALDFDEDSDVAMERNRVYPGGKVAVQSLTFSVQEGECFGFLGTNGAGKTTTLSMLSGEESTTDGSAYIFGKSIRTNPKAARQQIGFCPQFDAFARILNCPRAS
ncbi:hypothetical protein F8388_001580 [Cannabis sativa]|uniref:ABC transporter domain-containing protein n=1 Tax=Cannabis sativa TaxID=3483 RepID=A0A7J6HIU8_CANSA|nr:hypothetical protein F8388_001580 [Cannabis sativa]